MLKNDEVKVPKGLLFSTQGIAIVGVLSALNISSRVYLQMLPNVKPVATILILTTLILGWRFAAMIAVITILVSNALIGMGPWTFFQIAAWLIIVMYTALFSPLLKRSPMILTALYSAICGYLFGFIISLEQLMYGIPVFIGYWIRGLYFDTFHAAGNFVFYLICAPTVGRMLIIQKNKMVSSYNRRFPQKMGS